MTKSVEFSLDNKIFHTRLPKKCIYLRKYFLKFNTLLLETGHRGMKISFFLILSFFSKFREKC